MRRTEQVVSSFPVNIKIHSSEISKLAWLMAFAEHAISTDL